MLKRVLASAVLGAAAMSGAQATTSWDLGTYTVTYDETTTFGTLAGAFSSSDNSVGFTWNFAGDSSDLVTSLTYTNLSLLLPSFTITANASGMLYGPVVISIGKLGMTQVGAGAQTSATLNATYDAGSGVTPVGGALSVLNMSVSGPVTSGSYAREFSTAGSSGFSAYHFNGTLDLQATGGVFAQIQPTSDNTVQVRFFAAAVPEPETYAMWFAGLLGMAALGRRRRAR